MVKIRKIDIKEFINIVFREVKRCSTTPVWYNIHQPKPKMLHPLRLLFQPSLNVVRFNKSTNELIFVTASVLHVPSASFASKSRKGIDYSRVPKLSHDDIEERLVRGSGPGGQAVNKTSNCVMLCHKPTGIVVKCHITRVTESNRKLAREMLITKLDNMINGDQSVEGQRKAIEEKKSTKSDQKRRKRDGLKQKWKEREDEQSSTEADVKPSGDV